MWKFNHKSSVIYNVRLKDNDPFSFRRPVHQTQNRHKKWFWWVPAGSHSRTFGINLCPNLKSDYLIIRYTNFQIKGNYRLKSTRI